MIFLGRIWGVTLVVSEQVGPSGQVVESVELCDSWMMLVFYSLVRDMCVKHCWYLFVLLQG